MVVLATHFKYYTLFYPAVKTAGEGGMLMLRFVFSKILGFQDFTQSGAACSLAIFFGLCSALAMFYYTGDYRRSAGVGWSVMLLVLVVAGLESRKGRLG